MAEKREGKGIVPWRRFADLSVWERELEDFFKDFSERAPWRFRRSGLWPVSPFEFSVPSVDVYEEKDEVVVKVDLPGMDRDDIDVNITDSQLSIRGEKRKEEEVDEDAYYRSERAYGAFNRTIDLPSEVQTEKAKASFKNGVLEIRMPKSEEAKKRVKKLTVK